MKKVFSWLLVSFLLLGMIPTASLAATNDNMVTEYKTSYDNNNYFEFKVNGNTMTISGVCSNENINCIFLHIDNQLIDKCSIRTRENFQSTVDLSTYTNNSSISIEIGAGSQNSNSYRFDYVFDHSDISLKYDTNTWSFDVNQIVYKNNREFSSKWFNPGDALSKQSKEIIALSNRIVKEEKSNYEKIRLIHNWVADNIYYDWDSYRSRNIVIPDNPMEIVKDKKTVCQGYAELTQALVQAQNIPCLLVSGYALGVSTSGTWTNEAAKTTDSNHAWNEAYVDGRWVTMDVTWDSNNKYENGNYNYRGLRYPKYFDISEEQFSQDHKILERGSTWVDTPASWAQKEIAQAFSLELIPYSMQGDYANNIKRSEFCALAIRVMEKHDKKEVKTILSEKSARMNPSTFTDCSDENVLAAYALGIVKGKGNGLFDPNGEITRQEAALMLKNTANLLGVSVKESNDIGFNDKDKIAPWATDSIQFVSSIVDKTTDSPVMKGTVDGNFSPQAYYTREQAYCTMLRMFHILSQE